MRIGFVSFWFTRGQAFVTRATRSVCRDAGHETFVLARPDKLKGRVRTDGIWDEEHVEVASEWAIPREELLAWVRKHALDVCFFFQNDRFDDIAAVRATGCHTAGVFMWEFFAPEHVEPTRAAFDTLYAFNRCDTERYASLGLLVPRVRWSCWPELDGRTVEPKPADAPVVFYYPAGYLERRRAIEPTIKAFVRAKLPNATLLVKSTKPVKEKHQIRHPQVVYHADDVERDEYLELLRSCDVCLSNTRWEGLGLVIFESIAMGIPVICPDFPPMNENVRDGLTGLLVESSTRKMAPSGIPAADVKPRALTAAIRRLGDRREVERMSANTLRLRDLEYTWERTRTDVLLLLDDIARRRESA